MTEVLLTVPPLSPAVSPVVHRPPVSLQARPHSPVHDDRGKAGHSQHHSQHHLNSHLLSFEVWGVRCEVRGERYVLPHRLMSRNWSLISPVFCNVWGELWGLGQQWKPRREIETKSDQHQEAEWVQDRTGRISQNFADLLPVMVQVQWW